MRMAQVAGPEIFSHLLGHSEKAIRDLFEPANKAWRTLGDDSPLHVIVCVTGVIVCVTAPCT